MTRNLNRRADLVKYVGVCLFEMRIPLKGIIWFTVLFVCLSDTKYASRFMWSSHQHSYSQTLRFDFDSESRMSIFFWYYEIERDRHTTIRIENRIEGLWIAMLVSKFICRPWASDLGLHAVEKYHSGIQIYLIFI